jgi:hypothetical protein
VALPNPGKQHSTEWALTLLLTITFTISYWKIKIIIKVAMPVFRHKFDMIHNKNKFINKIKDHNKKSPSNQS